MSLELPPSNFRTNLINFRRRYCIVLGFVFYSARVISFVDINCEQIFESYDLQSMYDIIPGSYAVDVPRARFAPVPPNIDCYTKMLYSIYYYNLLLQLWVPDESIRKTKSRFLSRRSTKIDSTKANTSNLLRILFDT